MTHEPITQSHCQERVLLVDDDTALLHALPLTITLRIPHIKVEITDSAIEALKRLEQMEYDAIITDIKMPGMDGLALLHAIKERSPETPTILITGHGEHDLAIQALRGGAYDFIQKPIDREYFLLALQRAIHTCRLRRQVREQQRALESYATSLEALVAERTKELQEANAAKDRFLSIASHELRTPLTSLKMMIQLLHRRIEQRQLSDNTAITVIERATRRMEVLVQDLLSTSLIELGQLQLHKQPHDMVALCNTVIEEFQMTASPPVTLETKMPTEPLIAVVDSIRISQVLLNLLTNARKYSHAAHPISIHVMRQGETCVIEVHDQGIGIEAEQLPYIFERFYRVQDTKDTVQTSSSQGLGLGLYITRQIVIQHGGHISVQSMPGQGSTFTVSIPLNGQEDPS